MKSRRVGVLSAVILVVGALVLTALRWSAASEAVYPVERLVRLVARPVRIRLGGVLAGASAEAENDRLRREVRSLSVLRGDFERLRAENARLRKALDYAGRQPGTWIAAEVLSGCGGASAVRRAVCVGKGLLDGVRAGAVAVAPEGLVGRVVAVSPHTAEVALLTDSSVKVSCEIGAGAPGRTYGILCGGEPDGLLIRHLERAERALPRMRVVTSGLGGVFPRGLEVGTLLFVTNGVRGVEGEVMPCVDYSTLEDVFIRRDS